MIVSSPSNTNSWSTINSSIFLMRPSQIFFRSYFLSYIQLMWSFKRWELNLGRDRRTVWFMGNLFKAAMECEERSRRMNVIKQYLLSVRSFVRSFLIKRADLCGWRHHTRDTPVCCLSCCFETNRTRRPQKLWEVHKNFGGCGINYLVRCKLLTASLDSPKMILGT